MRNLFITLAVAAFVLTSGSYVLAENDSDRGGPGFHGSGMHKPDFHRSDKQMHEKRKEHFEKKKEEINNRLNLTEEQKAKA